MYPTRFDGLYTKCVVYFFVEIVGSIIEEISKKSTRFTNEVITDDNH